MTKQEIDRLFDEYSNGDLIMDKDEFAQAFHQILRLALEEAAVTAWSIGMELHMREHDVREVGSKIAKAIRALAQPNGETSK